MESEWWDYTVYEPVEGGKEWESKDSSTRQPCNLNGLHITEKMIDKAIETDFDPTYLANYIDWINKLCDKHEKEQNAA